MASSLHNTEYGRGLGSYLVKTRLLDVHVLGSRCSIAPCTRRSAAVNRNDPSSRHNIAFSSAGQWGDAEAWMKPSRLYTQTQLGFGCTRIRIATLVPKLACRYIGSIFDIDHIGASIIFFALPLPFLLS